MSKECRMGEKNTKDQLYCRIDTRVEDNLDETDTNTA